MFLLSKMNAIPKTVFYTVSELEGIIAKGNFAIITSENISQLSERFIVAKKIDG